MSVDKEPSVEKQPVGSKPPPAKMTLERAVELGEYNPEFLATFPEWHSYTSNIQFQYIRRAIENRRKHLLLQWAETNNILDFSKKPKLAEALKNIQAQLSKIEKDREKLYIEYSKKTD